MFLKFNKPKEEFQPARKRLSEIGGQEIINLYDGCRLGIVADIDLLVDDKTGSIEAMLIPENKSFASLFKDKDFIEVPWSSVKRIGHDTVIVELDQKSDARRRW